MLCIRSEDLILHKWYTMYEQVINQFYNELWKHHRGPDRMVVGFTITTAISAHQHYNQCLSPLMLWVRISIRARCTTLCDKVCQWLETPAPMVSSTNKTDRHDITEIMLKVALNTIKQTNKLKTSGSSIGWRTDHTTRRPQAKVSLNLPTGFMSPS